MAALPTVMLLRCFYERLLAGEPAAAALARVAAWLRDLDRPAFDAEVAALCERADPKTAVHLKEQAGEVQGEHPCASPIF